MYFLLGFVSLVKGKNNVATKYIWHPYFPYSK